MAPGQERNYDNLGKSFRSCTYPAGTWRLYNVISTSMQRHDVASTLRRLCIDVMCLLGSNEAILMIIPTYTFMIK